MPAVAVYLVNRMLQASGVLIGDYHIQIAACKRGIKRSGRLLSDEEITDIKEFYSNPQDHKVGTGKCVYRHGRQSF